MKTLFSNSLAKDYFSAQLKHVKSVVSDLSDAGIQQADRDKLAENIAQQKAVKPLILDKNLVAFVDTGRSTQKFNGRTMVQVQPFEYATYKIPFSGNKNLVEVEPSTFKPPKPRGRIVDMNIFVDVDNGTFFSGSEKLEKQIVNLFEEYYSVLEKYVEAINDDVKNHNAALENYIQALFEERLVDIAKKNSTITNLKPFKKG